MAPLKNMARLLDNMERLRWLPRDLGERHIFVNQAAFQLWVADGQAEVWRTNVVIGKRDTQTAAFHDQLETVVFNPAWGVPPSIITNEMLPIDGAIRAISTVRVLPSSTGGASA